MASGADPLHQQGAGFVVFEVARVGNGEHRDLERYELFAVVDSWHEKT